RWRAGRADSQRLSRPRYRHAAAGADRGDPGRRRQPARRLRRQLHRRLHLQFRDRAGAGSRLLRAVPADGSGPGLSAAGPVRPGADMTHPAAPADQASGQRSGSKMRALGASQDAHERVGNARLQPRAPARTVAALAVCAAVLLILPWVIGNEFYVNMASQVLIYALFALSINM